MSTEMPKAYQPADHEARLSAAWEASGAFAPRGTGEPYCIVLPPPNRTGTLHMGHATMLAIQDTLVRFHRLRGKRVLWVPGTDHAAIATQVKVEQLLRKQGIEDPRRTLGREAFLEKVREFAEGSRETINRQVRAMGSSCDWSRETYTLDALRNRAVFEMFRRMHEDGLIERGYRLVNWDPQFQTTLSDDEVQTKDVTAKLYTFRYAKDFPITISTTRPETKFGDTAVAVHPADERYQAYIGQTFATTFCGKPISIQVIADEAVDPSFGTGALGVTPAHAQVDWDMMEKHGLKMEVVIGRDGRLLPLCGDAFAGKTVEEARPLIAAALEADGLLENVEDVAQALPIAERGGAPVEQLPMEQWFLRVNKPFALRQNALNKWKKGDSVTLKELMIEAVQAGGTTIVPDRFQKTYFHWINNLRDWCISRQIWFGHRVPVWYDMAEASNGRGRIYFSEPWRVPLADFEAYPEKRRLLAVFPPHDPASVEVSLADFEFMRFMVDRSGVSWADVAHWMQSGRVEKIEAADCGVSMVAEAAPGESWVQDPDTLDTWFSSGMWTFSVFGWPEAASVDAEGNVVKTGDLAVYHPTSVLETGYDILFFWVARMLMMSTYALGEVPFKDVYLHGLVRDDQGRKMSKSLGNSLDPLDLIPKYGTDAVRLSVLMGSTPGQDLKLSETKIESLRNFTNKVWNISRYILATCPAETDASAWETSIATDADRWILARLEAVTADVTDLIERYQLSLAAERLRDFTWNDLADVYLEIAKVEGKKEALLIHVLRTLLTLLHPFMPFVTEAVWEAATFPGMLISQAWPTIRAERDETPHAFEALIALISDGRRLRAEAKVDAAKKLPFALLCDDATWTQVEANHAWIRRLLQASDLTRVEALPSGAPSTATGASLLALVPEAPSAAGLETLRQELADAERYLADVKRRLDNAEFIAKAPERVVADLRQKGSETEARIERLRAQLS